MVSGRARLGIALASVGLVLLAWLGRDAFARGQRTPLLALSAKRLPALSLPQAPLPAPKPIRIAFVGDVSLALGVGLAIQRGKDASFPFGAVKDELSAMDFAVGNLECVVAARGESTIPEPLAAPLRSPELLLAAGFDAVSIANNHALDRSAEGYFDTQSRLSRAGLPFFGVTSADAERPAYRVFEVRGLRVALVGHVDRGWQRARKDVREARKEADIVIVYVHWGVEYAQAPMRYQRVEGRALLDAGADAVIGAHSHVVQPAERYKGKLLAHGLGNFVFSSMTRPGTHTGAMVVLTAEKSGITSTSFRQVAIDDAGAPRFVGEASDEPVLDPGGMAPLPVME